MQSVQNFIDNLPSDWQRKACQALLKWYVAKDWINVYFFKVMQFDDPNGLFEETDNKTMRTIKLYRDSTPDEAAYRELVRAAVRLND
jgi:hypothetical protein